MQLSSTFCRSQQALHQGRATGVMLDNVRTIATKAAAAWGVEAEAAEYREAQREKAAGTAVSRSTRFEDDCDPMFSETLDRDLTES